MTEAEWFACEDPRPMLEPIRKTASGRKLCLLSLAWHGRFCPIVAGDIDPWEAFNWAADFDDPQLAVREVVEQFPDYWEFDGTAWGFAELMMGPEAHGLWPEARTLVREIFGNPFQPVVFDSAWRTSDVLLLARGIYAERTFGGMPILADALQDAGCDSDDILGHLRDASATHVRGCWALDLVLGKE